MSFHSVSECVSLCVCISDYCWNNVSSLAFIDIYIELTYYPMKEFSIVHEILHLCKFLLRVVMVTISIPNPPYDMISYIVVNRLWNWLMSCAVCSTGETMISKECFKTIYDGMNRNELNWFWIFSSIGQHASIGN